MADYEPRGITVRDVAAADFIKAYAEHLKNTGRVELPSWCDLVKTAPHKEMCPYDQDWYYIRAGESRMGSGGGGRGAEDEQGWEEKEAKERAVYCMDGARCGRRLL